MGKIFWIIIASAGLAALLHVFFFLMESVFWTSPAVMKIFRRREADTAATRLLALNQGFYNLFLALGNISGICLITYGNSTLYNPPLLAGMTLVASNCAVMLGAAIVLLASSPKMLRGALIQGLPPLLTLILLVIAAFGG